MRTKQAIVGAFAALMLVAGCGGGLSEEEYQQEVEGILEPLGTRLQEIGNQQVDPNSLDDVAAQLGEADTVLQDGIDDLEGIEPPEDLQAPHDRMIGALETFEQATADAETAAEDGDAQAIVQDYPAAATEFQAELDETVQDFQDAGLDVNAPTP